MRRTPGGNAHEAVLGAERDASRKGTLVVKTFRKAHEPDGVLAQGAMVPVSPVTPRLLDLHGASAYLGLSEWTVRDLQHAGVLPRVRVPLPHQGELRKILFDRVDLDRLIEAWKESGS